MRHHQHDFTKGYFIYLSAANMHLSQNPNDYLLFTYPQYVRNNRMAFYTLFTVLYYI